MRYDYEIYYNMFVIDFVSKGRDSLLRDNKELTFYGPLNL